MGICAHSARPCRRKVGQLRDELAVYDARARPSLRSAQDNHWPYRPFCIALKPCFVLDRADVRNYGIECCRHERMHDVRLVPFYEVGRISITRKKLNEFFIRHTTKNGRVCDLVTIEVQNRKHSSVARRIRKLVRMPAGRKGSRFGLSVPYDAADQ